MNPNETTFNLNKYLWLQNLREITIKKTKMQKTSYRNGYLLYKAPSSLLPQFDEHHNYQ